MPKRALKVVLSLLFLEKGLCNVCQLVVGVQQQHGVPAPGGKRMTNTLCVATKQ